MKKLINPMAEPPNGFTYVDDDTGYMTVGASLSSLIQIARDHRRANELPIPEDFAAQVEHHVCLENPPSFSTGALAAGESHSSVLDEYRIRRNVQSLLNGYKAHGKELVDPNLANRRAETCVGCAENIQSPICLGCVGLIDFAHGYFSRTTPVDKQLKVCRQTACMLKTQVHIPDEALIDFEADFPDQCWYGSALAQRSS